MQYIVALFKIPLAETIKDILNNIIHSWCYKYLSLWVIVFLFHLLANIIVYIVTISLAPRIRYKLFLIWNGDNPFTPDT